MIYTEVRTQAIPIFTIQETPRSEISRLLSAAVINSQFRSVLLSNPMKAIASGFGGEGFQISEDLQHKMILIHATSLSEFARKVNKIILIH